MRPQSSNAGRRPSRGGRGRGMFDAGSPEIIAKLLIGFLLGPPGWLWLLYKLAQRIGGGQAEQGDWRADDGAAVLDSPAAGDFHRPAPRAQATRPDRARRDDRGVRPPAMAAVRPATPAAGADADGTAARLDPDVAAPRTLCSFGRDHGPYPCNCVVPTIATAAGGVLPPAVGRVAAAAPAFRRVTISAAVPKKPGPTAEEEEHAAAEGRDAESRDLGGGSTEPSHLGEEEFSSPAATVPLADDSEPPPLEPDFLYEEPDEQDQAYLASLHPAVVGGDYEEEEAWVGSEPESE